MAVPKPSSPSNARLPDTDGLRRIRAESGIREKDSEKIDLDDEAEPGLPMRPTQEALDAVDLDHRADDESPPDVVRVLRK